MTYKEFTKEFKSRTAAIDYQMQIDLAVVICKKLYFDYQEFFEKNNWGNSDLILDTINFINVSRNLTVDENLLQKRIDEIENVTPDTEDFDNASYALNACVAVLETLQFMIDLNPDHIFDVGTCLTDTIDFKIQEDFTLEENEIDNHPEMVRARNLLLGLTR